jgi:beta-lactamase regulating signal transducer with metallopeptidase domain
MLCLSYVIVISALLGAVGILVERVLPPAFPRRWMWCVIIVSSIALPGYNRYHHNFSVTAALEQQSVRAVLHNSFHAASLGIADPAWWVRAESYDAMINPLWVAASMLVALWGLINVLRVAWLVYSARRAAAATGRRTVIDGVPVLVTDRLGPATVGVLRSRVLVPKWVLTLPKVQRRYVVHHEDQHRKSHDALVLFVASLTLIIMPWNVALWWQLRRLSLAVELDCDNRVVSTLGNPRAYGELLLKVAEAASKGPRLQPALLGMGSLEKRLAVLLAPTRLRQAQKFLLPALAVGLLAAILSMPHPVTGHGSHASAAMSSHR